MAIKEFVIKLLFFRILKKIFVDADNSDVVLFT